MINPKDEDNIVLHIELRDVYDGWSVAITRCGQMLNRWDVTDKRHAKTQEWINARREAGGSPLVPTPE